MMNEVTLLLDPMDVLMFRDSRPFGQVTSDTASEFPAPRTTAGAVRSWLLTGLGVDLSRLRTLPNRETTARALLEQRCCPPDHPAHWVLDAKLFGPFLYNKDGEFSLFAAPHNLAVEEDHKYNYSKELLTLCPQPNLPTRYTKSEKTEGYAPLWVNHPRPWSNLDGSRFIESGATDLYLAGTPFNQHSLKLEDELFSGETRVGIGMNSDLNTTEEGQLYASVFMRLKPKYAFAVSIKAKDINLEKQVAELIKKNPWVRLGGEAKFAKIRALSPTERLLPEAPSEWPPASGQFFTYLVTPGLFEGGNWLPEEFSRRYTLIGATVSTPQTVSGWDVGHNRPVPYKSAAPAGSVYFWKLKEDQDWGHDPHGQSISDSNEDKQAGWGICLRGDW